MQPGSNTGAGVSGRTNPLVVHALVLAYSKPVSRLTFAASQRIIMVFIWCNTASIM